MTFGLRTRVGPGNHVLDGVQRCRGTLPWQLFFGFLCMGCSLAPPCEYDWTVHVWWRCGLMSHYFDHLLAVAVVLARLETNTSCYLRASINFLCKLIIYITISGSKLYLHLINYNYSNNSVGNTNLPYSSPELKSSNKQWNKMRRPITLDNSWSPDRPNSRPLDEQSAVFVHAYRKAKDPLTVQSPTSEANPRLSVMINCLYSARWQRSEADKLCRLSRA